MTNSIAKIRAALEMARELVPAGLGMPAYANDDLSALAELERAAAEPLFILTTGAIGSDGEQDDWDIECESSRRLESFCAAHPGSTVALYAAPPAPVAEIREVVVTDEMCNRVFDRAYDLQSECGEDTSAHEESHAWLTAWRSELGPTLGLVELKEPTPEECERISMAYYDDEALVDRDHRHLGKDMFDACRAVLWPKEGE